MITSMQNETIKNIMKLKQKKYRDEHGLFLIEGYHLVEEARKACCIETIITTLDEEFDEKTIHVSSHVMGKLAFTKTPQPIMAICHQKKHQNVELNGKRYMLLDRVQDPGNVGTIVRTALAFGYDAIIMSKDCVDLYNDKVIRSTQGAMFQIDVFVMDLTTAIHELKKQGVKVYGTALYHASSIRSYQKEEKMAFVMGNEGQGISQEILDICDDLLYIPIQNIESLNVGVAASITMYHFL